MQRTNREPGAGCAVRDVATNTLLAINSGNKRLTSHLVVWERDACISRSPACQRKALARANEVEPTHCPGKLVLPTNVVMRMLQTFAEWV